MVGGSLLTLEVVMNSPLLAPCWPRQCLSSLTISYGWVPSCSQPYFSKQKEEDLRLKKYNSFRKEQHEAMALR